MMGQICCTAQDFSHQKTLYIFDSKPDIILKRRLFFRRKIFPPKRLSFFFPIFLTLYGAIPIRPRTIFPDKRLSFFFDSCLPLYSATPLIKNNFPAKILSFSIFLSSFKSTISLTQKQDNIYLSKDLFYISDVLLVRFKSMNFEAMTISSGTYNSPLCLSLLFAW